MKKRIYELIEASKELPEKNNSYAVLKVGFPCPDMCELYPEGWKKDYPAQVVTHWLKDAGEQYVFTEIEFQKFLLDYGDAIRFRYEEKFLTSKGLTTNQHERT